eukprot:CAMPEP_0115319100 /NCGR_PEP_ID=MMETSP0270-20121206/79565_1 /TAXON_ID=71861 /ORGANISM="Scrippsiella trochoidea, Strain CCMP3099" /LENGTH=173 /DNA_ID=CAMNT_0002738729 /DNA_START=200 /DNA_END=720 /DNA_ORIENTATION=+
MGFPRSGWASSGARPPNETVENEAGATEKLVHLGKKWLFFVHLNELDLRVHDERALEHLRGAPQNGELVALHIELEEVAEAAGELRAEVIEPPGLHLTPLHHSGDLLELSEAPQQRDVGSSMEDVIGAEHRRNSPFEPSPSAQGRKRKTVEELADATFASSFRRSHSSWHGSK